MQDEDSISIATTILSETDFELNDHFDASSYNIPSSGPAQSLESILNESDTRSLISDWDASITGPPSSTHASPAHNSAGSSVCSASEVSSWSTASTFAGRGLPLRKPIRYDGHGPCLKLDKQLAISATLAKQIVNNNVGTASCMYAGGCIVVIGTLHGYVLIFNEEGGLLHKLGTSATCSSFGAVSSLCLNRDCSRILVGHANGQITMWDCNTGKLLRTIIDAHPPQMAVLHIKFTDDLTLAIFSDSGGSVYELSFKRIMGVRSYDSRCLFSGSRGEVCVVEPLLTSEMRASSQGRHIAKGHTQDIVVLAMCSLSKIILMTIRPETRVFFIHTLKGEPDTLPLIAWQYAIIESHNTKRSVQPIVSFGRENHLHFYQVSIINAHSIACTRLQKIQLGNFNIISMKWLNSRTLVVMDTNEIIHIIDVRSQQQLDTYDCSSLKQVYSTLFYRSLATGGNVSEAMAFSGRMACFNTISVNAGSLYLLGEKSVHAVSIRTWIERVDKMVAQGRYEDAIGWLEQCKQGKAKAVVGITAKFNVQIIVKWEEIILAYMNELASSLNPHGACIDDILFHYKSNIPAIVECCLSWNKQDFLFNEIFEICSKIPDCLESFLFAMEQYIKNDQIKRFTPAVAKSFVNQYEEVALFDELQVCLIKLDVCCYDIDQIVKLCWKHHLYDLLIHVYNVAMSDYLSPFKDMTLRLNGHIHLDDNDSLKPMSDSHIELGNKAFVYLSCCLSGQPYISGQTLTPKLSQNIREETFTLLTSLYANHTEKDGEIYLILKTLIHFNERDFFNILTLNLEDAYYRQEKWVEKIQRLVDILLQIMVHSSSFNETQKGVLFTFLARQLSHESNKLFVNRDLFHQVLESLCKAGCSSLSCQRHEEIQQTLKELLVASDNLKFQLYDRDHLISIVRQAKFYDIMERMHSRHHEHHLVVECYLDDSSRRHKLFAYVNSLMQDDSLAQLQRDLVVDVVVDRVQDMTGEDSWQTAALLLSHVSDRLNTELFSRFTDRKLLFNLLRDIDTQVKEASTAYLEAQHETDLCVAYVDLMCQYRPLAVEHYLASTLASFVCGQDDSSPCPDGQSAMVNSMLEVCIQNDVRPGTSFLLEKLDRHEEAFKVLFKGLTLNIESFKLTETKEGRIRIFGEIDAICGASISFCQRSSTRMNARQCETMWLCILDIMLDNQKLFSLNMKTEFQHLTTQFMNGMMGHVSLQTMVKRILQSPSQVNAIGNIRQFMLDMISNYEYEKTLLDCVVKVLHGEMRDDFNKLGHLTRRGRLVPSLLTSCDLCDSTGELPSSRSSGAHKYFPPASTLVNFGCGHTFHASCLVDGSTSASSPHDPSDLRDPSDPLCPRCQAVQQPGLKNVRVAASQSSPKDYRFKTRPKYNNITTAATEDGNGEMTSCNLNNKQLAAMLNLRQSQHTESRMEILSHLSKKNSLKNKSPLDKKIKMNLMPGN